MKRCKSNILRSILHGNKFFVELHVTIWLISGNRDRQCHCVILLCELLYLMNTSVVERQKGLTACYFLAHLDPFASQLHAESCSHCVYLVVTRAGAKLGFMESLWCDVTNTSATNYFCSDVHVSEETMITVAAKTRACSIDNSVFPSLIIAQIFSDEY